MLMALLRVAQARTHMHGSAGVDPSRGARAEIMVIHGAWFVCGREACNRANRPISSSEDSR